MFDNQSAFDDLGKISFQKLSQIKQMQYQRNKRYEIINFNRNILTENSQNDIFNTVGIIQNLIQQLYEYLFDIVSEKISRQKRNKTGLQLLEKLRQYIYEQKEECDIQIYNQYIYCLVEILINSKYTMDMKYETLWSLSLLTGNISNLNYDQLIQVLINESINLKNMTNQIQASFFYEQLIICLGNIAADQEKYLIQILNSPVIQILIEILYINQPKLVSNALWCLTNLTQNRHFQEYIQNFEVDLYIKALQMISQKYKNYKALMRDFCWHLSFLTQMNGFQNIIFDFQMIEFLLCIPQQFQYQSMIHPCLSDFQLLITSITVLGNALPSLNQEYIDFLVNNLTFEQIIRQILTIDLNSYQNQSLLRELLFLLSNLVLISQEFRQFLLNNNQFIQIFINLLISNDPFLVNEIIILFINIYSKDQSEINQKYPMILQYLIPQIQNSNWIDKSLLNQIFNQSI